MGAEVQTICLTFRHTREILFSLSLSVQTWWDERDTCRRLSDRAWDVARCKEALESCALKVDQEMEALALVKHAKKKYFFA